MKRCLTHRRALRFSAKPHCGSISMAYNRMSIMKRILTLPTALITAALLLFAPVQSFAEYPEKPIHLILPFPAGGAVDFVARLFAQKLVEDLGKPIIIENKSGASGVIATDAVAKAAS